MTPNLTPTGAIEVANGEYRYRYRLWRIWDPTAQVMVWVLLNPSEANEKKDDPTLRRCIGFAKRHRYGGVILVNLFAFSDPKPKKLRLAPDPIGPQNNDEHVLWACRESATIVAGWGAHRFAFDQARHICELIRGSGRELRCFGKTKDGHPRHPGRLAYSSVLEFF